jgi:two-component system, NarL family, nitrate/nitrite response regulator NarL
MVERAALRVMIADDHPMFRTGLVLSLRQQGFGTVDEAVDGQHAVDLHRGRAYEVVVLDLRMPRLNGLDAARAILAVESHARPIVLLLTTFNEPAVVDAARRAGIVAVLGKETDPAHLARKIDALVASGGATRDAEPAIPALTPRERDVLASLVRGMSTKEISSGLGISPETVKDYLGRLMGKLNARDRVSLVSEAHRLGLALLQELERDDPAL